MSSTQPPGLLAVVTPTDVLTWHNDNARTGQNLTETALTPANVNSASFGKLFTLSVDGKVDAQPLHVANLSTPGSGSHNVVIIATEHDSVFAFDSDTGARLWQISVLGPGETTSDRRRCFQIAPEIGITATPVIDRSTGPSGTIYVIAMSKNSAGKYFQRLHALNLATGAEEFGGPVEVHATFPGTGDGSRGGIVNFDAGQYDDRAALLLSNGVVYTSWSSHCDIRPYTGWVIGYDEKTLAQTSVFNTAPNGNEASFWNSGAGPASDSSGNLYALVANGTFDTNLDAGGFPGRGDFGNAFLKLSTADRHLAPADYFATFDVVSQSDDDNDLGSGGAMLLPDLQDAKGTARHLAIGAGKDSNIYLVDRDNMGKFHPDRNNIYQELPGALGGEEFGAPAYFNGHVYYGGVDTSLKAFALANARLRSSPSSETRNSFRYPGTTPAISASGSKNGIVWAAENGSNAVLHAYDANDLSHELYNSDQAPGGRDHFGAGNKFITPMVANGKVFVGTTSGVGVFGLLH
ncbi:MAG TPA: pyrrolo-quinoline quinone [Terriglobales bacterium]|nr:pyrrolo-quinoline quinone [Terriglobales bacterium]